MPFDTQQPAELPAAIRRREQAEQIAGWLAGLKKSYGEACDAGADTHTRECEAILGITRAFCTLSHYADTLDILRLSPAADTRPGIRDVLAMLADMAGDVAGLVAMEAQK